MHNSLLQQHYDDWSGSGPLPTADLEHIAWLIFRDRYPRDRYDDPRCSDWRNDCRRFALQLREKFAAMDRWTLGNAVDHCARGMAQFVAGDRGLSPGASAQIRDYAESCIEDLAALFSGDARARADDDDYGKRLDVLQ